MEEAPNATTNIESTNTILHALVEGIPYYIFWKDTQLIYRGCNKNFASLINRSAESVKGLTDYELGWGRGEADQFREADQVVMQGHVQVNIEERLKQEHDEDIIMMVSKVPLIDKNNNCIGLLGISTDITQRKKMELQFAKAKENAEQLRHAITILAGSIAHDLRTPIASINLYTKLLTEEINTLATDKAKKLLSRLQNVTHEMNQNIDTTLQTISAAVKGSNEKQTLTTCDIGQCLNHVLDNYPFEDDEKNLVSWQSNHPFTFKGNTINFYRILFNLLKNALYQIDKQKKGEIIISTASEGDYNLLKFKDTAGGITEDMIKDIFSGFNTTKQGGTGVGLAFCQLAMQSMGGDIACHIVDGDCIEFVLMFGKEVEDE